jgi:two-component system OmpR family sensor kinase
VPPGSLVILGDGDRLRQVLTNLVGNVARYTPVGSPVELAVGVDAAPDARAVIEVRDHGPGLTPAQVERVFERFYRAESSRGRDRGGSGLGLAIVAAIVGAHRGHVTAVAPPQGGLVVRVELPLSPTV